MPVLAGRGRVIVTANQDRYRAERDALRALRSCARSRRTRRTRTRTAASPCSRRSTYAKKEVGAAVRDRQARCSPSTPCSATRRWRARSRSAAEERQRRIRASSALVAERSGARVAGRGVACAQGDDRLRPTYDAELERLLAARRREVAGHSRVERRGEAMMRRRLLVLVARRAAGVPGAWQQTTDPRATGSRARRRRASLDEAERMARARWRSIWPRSRRSARHARAARAGGFVLSAPLSRRRPGRQTYGRGQRWRSWRIGAVIARRRSVARACSRGAYEQIRRAAGRPDDRVAAGRAYRVLGDAQRRGRASGARRVRSRRAGRFDQPRATTSRRRPVPRQVQRAGREDLVPGRAQSLAPNNARALLGLARVAEFEGKLESMTLLRRAVCGQSVARARAGAARALSPRGRGVRLGDSGGASRARGGFVIDCRRGRCSARSAWLKGDSAEYNRAKRGGRAAESRSRVSSTRSWRRRRCGSGGTWMEFVSRARRCRSTRRRRARSGCSATTSCAPATSRRVAR